jgi:two-component system, NtrC family, nitrogen regulation sensor histidine kinase NtrY
MTIPNSNQASRAGTLHAPSSAWWLAIGAVVLFVFVVLLGAASFMILKGISATNLKPAVLIGIALVNLILVVSLVGLLALPLLRLARERRSGRAGARLHVRMVAMFSAVAVVPVILVAVFAAVTLNLGVESWFSSRVKTALEGATNVAQAYATEHERGIYNDAAQIADSIQNDPTIIDAQLKKVNQARMFARIEELTKSHQLDATFVVDSRGNLLGSTVPIDDARIVWSPALVPSPADYAAARAKNVVFGDDAKKGIVHGLVQLKALNDAYLLVVRYVDPDVLGYYQRTQEVVTQYRNLEKSRSSVQKVFAGLYAAVSLVILLAAIWLGLWAANRIVRPISRLIGAAERVSEGDLKAQVAVERDDDEIGTLGLAFNRMTQQLDTQRSALVAANQQIDERRRFTETVLAGVSAGVIGVDAEGQITIVNRAAARLLNAAPEELEGQHYAEAVPELAALIRRAIQEPVARSSGEATVKRAGTTRTLSVQVTSEVGRQATGYVATFDDITDLVSAQRTAAWADVARRIAHEIKNPLTPIQLSAERLKRKYSEVVGDDRAIFEQCTDTIIRQVGDIGRMVDEFSSFARMPTPIMRRECAQELIQQAVFLQRVAHPQITFETHLPKELVWFECDGRLVSQALTNVIKNATESIAARLANGDDAPGKILVAIDILDSLVAFRITDNGVGLPAEHRHRLTEPYVTTRAKGTGLGLAIVRKVMEDHGGEILLEDAAEDAKGARVSLVFPSKQRNVREKGMTDEQTRIATRV